MYCVYPIATTSHIGDKIIISTTKKTLIDGNYYKHKMLLYLHQQIKKEVNVSDPTAYAWSVCKCFQRMLFNINNK